MAVLSPRPPEAWPGTHPWAGRWGSFNSSFAERKPSQCLGFAKPSSSQFSGCTDPGPTLCPVNADPSWGLQPVSVQPRVQSLSSCPASSLSFWPPGISLPFPQAQLCILNYRVSSSISARFLLDEGGWGASGTAPFVLKLCLLVLVCLLKLLTKAYDNSWILCSNSRGTELTPICYRRSMWFILTSGACRLFITPGPPLSRPPHSPPPLTLTAHLKLSTRQSRT